MLARLRRFSGLPGAAKMLFLRTALLLPAIRLSLRLRGFRTTQRFLEARVAPARPPLSEAAAERDSLMVSRMVAAAARYCPIPSSCLERSMALWWLLARRGIAAQLRIGARKDAGKFEAHAWVERNGTAIGEPESWHLHYQAFDKEF